MNKTTHHRKDAKPSKLDPNKDSSNCQTKSETILDDIDREIVQLLQFDFPLVQRPWREISLKLNVSEEEIVTRLKRLHIGGVIRKIGPIIDGSKIGLAAATLVALKVPEDKVDATARIINEYRNVSHNYEREHDYNIWFTLSAPTQQEIETTLNEITQKAGLNPTDVLNLPTKQRFKINVQFQLTEHT